MKYLNYNYIITSKTPLKVIWSIIIFVFMIYPEVYGLIYETNITWKLLVLVLLRWTSVIIWVGPIFLRGFGFFHLFTFPIYLSIVRKLVDNFDQLLTLHSRKSGIVLLDSRAIFDKSLLLDLNLQHEFLNILFFLIYYSTFLMFYKTKSIAFESRMNLFHVGNLRVLLITILLFGAFLIFFKSQGGIIGWIGRWGMDGGRRAAMEDFGIIIKLASAVFVIPLVIYLNKGFTSFFNPLFILLFCLSLSLVFLTSGSRSGVILLIIPFFFVHTLKGGQVNLIKAFFFVLMSVFLFSSLGQIRRESTYTGGNFNSANLAFSYSTLANDFGDEVEMRSKNNANLAVYNSVLKTNVYLSGQTYIAAISFFVPRFLWREKPRSAGYYAGLYVFDEAVAFPLTIVAESYWNFGYFGVIAIALLQGLILSSVTNFLFRRMNIAFWIVIYSFLLYFPLELTSESLTPIFQIGLFLLPILKLLNLKSR